MRFNSAFKELTTEPCFLLKGLQMYISFVSLQLLIVTIRDIYLKSKMFC